MKLSTTSVYALPIALVLCLYVLNRLQNPLSSYSLSTHHHDSVMKKTESVSLAPVHQNQTSLSPPLPFIHSDEITASIYKYREMTSSLKPKAFRSWQQRFGNNTPLPCIIDHRVQSWSPFNDYIQRQPTMEGFLFVKIEKAASSTLAGIAARISVKVGQRLHKANPNFTRWYDDSSHQWHTAQPICRTRMSHLWSTRGPQVFLPGKRPQQKSFLWTFFKEPSRRVLSEFFYFFVDLAKPEKRKPTDDATVIDYLMMHGRGSQIHKILPQRSKVPQWTGAGGDPQKTIAAWARNDTTTKMNVSAVVESPEYQTYRTKVTKYVQSAVNQMDFVGIVERMDESLVLLQWILGLEGGPGDVMAINAKSAGSYLYKRKPKQLLGTCVVIPKHALSPNVKAFIESDEWKYVWNLADYMMYEAIQKSLNHTMETAMGRESFRSALETFHTAQRLVETQCSPPHIALSCSPNGTAARPSQKDPCYYGGSGCGYKCLDRLFGS